MAASVVKAIREFFRLISPAEPASEPDFIEILSQPMPILYRRHGRARNYVLRLHANGSVVVTIPRQGAKKFAREFVASRKSWLEKQWRLLEGRKAPPQDLRPGMEILLHGRTVVLEVKRQGEGWELQAGPERTALAAPEGNLRPALEEHLQAAARSLLVPRVEELAREHSLESQTGRHPQSEEPVGFVFVPGDHFAELALDPVAGGGAGLHHRTRADASAAVEPFAAVLDGSWEGLPGLPHGGGVAEAEFGAGRFLGAVLCP